MAWGWWNGPHQCRYSFGASSVDLQYSNLGPFEAFCTRAPSKHVAHRVCIPRLRFAHNDSQRPRRPERVGLGIESFKLHSAT
jgi:hypothetical protein